MMNFPKLARYLLMAAFSIGPISLLAQSESCGPITLELYDSYGDGWNGNDMDVISNSGTTTTYTLSSGSYGSYAITVGYGDTLQFSWQAGGSWASECSYKIKDASGNYIYQSPSGSSMTAGAVQDTVYCNTLSTCSMPTNLSVTTGAYDAALSWDGASSYSYHLVEYDTTGFTPGTGDTMWVYSDTAYITGLMAATAYDFRVTTICSVNDSSMTAASNGQYTQCAALATPWSENFDNTASGAYNNPSLPNCWDYYNCNAPLSYAYPYWYTRNYSFYANSGSQMLYGYKSGSTSTSSAYVDSTIAIMPVIQGLDSATKQIEFYSRTSSASYDGMVIVGVTNANGDASSLKIVDTVYSTTAYAKQTVYLDAAAGITSGDARVAFVWIRDFSYDYVYIDDVTIKDIPACPEPINFGLISTQQTKATFTWQSSSPAFLIEYGPSGFTQGTGNVYSSSTNSYQATGLSQNTYYDVYLLANCASAGNGLSNWVGPFTFKTECGDQAVPYSTGFEGFSSGNSSDPNLPDCWAYAKTGTTTSFYAYNYSYSYYANTGDNSVRFYGYTNASSSNNQGDTLAAFSPRIAGLSGNDKQVIFNVRSSSALAYYNTKLIIATADSNASLSSIHIVDTITHNNVYQEFTVDLDNVPSNASRVVFMISPEMVSGYSYFYTYTYLDDIEIRNIPACPIPLNISGNATSDTSATFTWSDSSVVSDYIIEWGPSGFTQGTGTPYDTVSGFTSWSIDTLESNTTYDFYIKSNCNSQLSTSPWEGPYSITTPCSPTSVPWADGFETLPSWSGNSQNPNLPDCWTYDGTYGTSYSMGYDYSYYAFSGFGLLYNYMYANGGDTNVVSTPMIQNLDQGGNVLTFWARTNSTSYPGGFNVVATDAMGNYETARVLQSFNLAGNTSYQELQIYLDSTVMQAGDMRVGFMMYSKSTYDYVFIDSVQIDPMPSCINYNQMAANITDSSADLTWSYTGNNCFNIEWGPAGFIQGTGVGAQAGTVDSNVTAPYTLNGLSPNTSYDFYVENCCNPGQWEGPFTFTTECTGPLAAGTYSVGATGDFATLDSVMSVLNTCGIAGSVTFEFQSGSFSSSSPIGAVSGVSATSTITFKGSPSVNDTLGALVLDGASYVTLEDLFIRSTGGHTIRLNGTDHITITGCTIDAGASTSTANIPITASADGGSYSMFTGGEEHLTLTNNTIKGGYFGMTMYGSSLNLGAHHDITISDNEFSGQYYYGLYIYYARDVEIEGNTIGGFTNTYNYAAYLYNIDGCVFTKNMVDSYYSVLAYYLGTSSDATLDSEISNNMFNNGYYGLRVYYGADLGVYHNTCVGSYYGFYDYYNGSGTDIRNNIFQGGSYALYSYNSSAYLDYNLYSNQGTYIAYIYNGSYHYPTDSAALATVDTTKNQNSRVGDPIFAGSNDLHVFGPLANDHGDNSVGVTEDIDGDTRPMSGSTTVDIGADEYDMSYSDAALTAIVSPSNGTCGGDSLLVSVEITNYGLDTLVNLTVGVDLLGVSLTQTFNNLEVPFASKDTVMLGYVSNYVGGPMSVLAYTQLFGDDRSTNDTMVTSVVLNDAQQVSTNAPGQICYGDSFALKVIHPSAGTAIWKSGGDTVAIADVDSIMYLSNFTSDTTFTVNMINSTYTLQNYKGIGTGGGNYNYFGSTGVQFSATQAFTLEYVTLYPNAAGSTNVEIQDITTGTAIWSGTLTTTATGNNAEQVFVGAQVPAGNYQMVATSSTTGGLYREYGVTGYPFSTPGGEISVTQGTLTNYHYFFYNWVVTLGGCERPDTTFTIHVVNEPDTIIPTTQYLEICAGDSITLEAPLADGYLWNNGETSRSITVGTSGTYVVTSDFPGCYIGYDTIVLTVNALPQSTLSYSGTGNICAGDTLNVSLASGYSYLWNTGSMDAAIEVSDSITVYATITDTTTQCSVTSDTLTTTVSALPATTITLVSSSNEVCYGDSVEVSVDGIGTYQWNNGLNTGNVSLGSSGTYWSTVTDSNGCSVITDSIDVIVNTLPIESISNIGTSVFCDGDSTILSLSGQNTYNWSNGLSTDQITVFSSGSYYAEMTDSNGCQNFTDTATITVNTLPLDSVIITGNTEFCDGDSVVITALPNAQYSWSTGSSSNQIVIYSSSNITGVVTDLNGCSRQLDTVSVIVNPIPNDSIYVSGPTTFCQGDSVIISSVDLAAGHLWNTSDTTSNVIISASGAYHVALTTDKGCVSLSDTVDVVVNPNPNANISIIGSLDLCPGDSVTLQANSGLLYSWSTGDSTQSITLSQSAAVVLDVTNSFGCTSTSNTQNVVLHSYPNTSPIIGDSVGVVPNTQYTYSVSSTAGHTYLWSALNGAIVAGQGTSTATVMWSQDTVGSVTVVESNGYCSDTATLEIRTNIGVSELIKSQFTIYPNPTQGLIVIQSEKSLGNYELYDAMGSRVFYGSSHETELQLDLTEYPNGVYYINLSGIRFRIVLVD